MDQKIPCAPLKTCQSILTAAGSSAALNGYPWTVCVALATGLVGTAECNAAHEAYVTVLQAYVRTARLQSGIETPEWITKFIEAGAEAIKV